MRYPDRAAAGSALVEPVRALGRSGVVVLGLPRGGVPVAASLARGLGAPLDVVIARKVGAPSRPELGVGAVAEGGVVVLDRTMAARLGISDDELADGVAASTAEVVRRAARYRGERPLVVDGRDVVVVDDGVATGVTAEAALRAVRAAGARTVVFAAPVGAPESVRRLAAHADHVVCPHQPERFVAVGQFYDTFDQTPDTEVLELLQTSR